MKFCIGLEIGLFFLFVWFLGCTFCCFSAGCFCHPKLCGTAWALCSWVFIILFFGQRCCREWAQRILPWNNVWNFSMCSSDASSCHPKLDPWITGMAILYAFVLKFSILLLLWIDYLCFQDFSIHHNCSVGFCFF